MKQINSYIICDSFDGRTLRLLTRISTRKLARKATYEFSKTYEDGCDLIECKNDGERLHVQHYVPKR